MSFDVESIIQKVTETLKTETVVGQPIQIGAITMIPIINVSFGFGAGGGDDRGNGTGGGGGARMTVAGMMVVKGDDVSFIPTGKGSGMVGSLDRLLDKLPDLIEKVSPKAAGKCGESKTEGE